MVTHNYNIPLHENQQFNRHWRVGVLELTSQALARYFSSGQDPRHLAIYESLAQLLDSGIEIHESLGGGRDSR